MSTKATARKAANVAAQLTSATTKSRAAKSVQIVSPTLCDDVIKRLGSSLSTHHGCDLIDLNPGTCLWSQKLHEAIKPRRHILIEPERQLYQKFINPLLESSKRYQYAELFSEVLKSDSYLSKDNLQTSHQNYTNFNKSLLLTANLSGATTIPQHIRANVVNYFINHLYVSFFGQGEDIYRHGLIRVLAWVPESSVSTIIPRTVYGRSKQAVQFEACSDIVQITGSSWKQSPHVMNRERRWHDLDIENMTNVRQGEVLSGRSAPLNRYDPLPYPPVASLPDISPEALAEAEQQSDTNLVRDFLNLDAELREKDPTWYQTHKLKKAKNAPQETSDQKKWRQHLARMKRNKVIYTQTSSILTQQRQLEQEWRDRAISQEHPATHLDELNFIRRAEVLKSQIDRMNADHTTTCRKAIDDYRAHDCSSQTLAWNMRKIEPLLVQPDEFAPQEPLALIDITPKPNFRQRLDTYNKGICFDYMLVRLSAAWNKSVLDALHDILQAGVDEFIETIPSLKRIECGGWYNLNDLRVRSLPANLFIDIGLAYERWPFRSDADKLWLDMSKDYSAWNKQEVMT